MSDIPHVPDGYYWDGQKLVSIRRDSNELMRWLIPPWWDIRARLSIWRRMRYLRRTR